MLENIRSQFEIYINRLGIGMRGKLIFLFVAIKVAPLLLLALLAWWQFWHLGEDLRERTEILAETAKNALATTGNIALTDTLQALDNFARDDIERLTTDTAKNVADFLYARDADIRLAASLPPDETLYKNFIQNKAGRVVTPGEWVLSPEKNMWQPAAPKPQDPNINSSNKENALNFHYRPPDSLRYASRPLFLEMTFVDTDGKERLKVTTTDRLSKTLNDVSRRENTYARAETYFPELKKLKPGEIYVSEVIGTYVPSKLIGIFTPENAAKVGIPFEPEAWAFAGKENPLGKRFQGIVRWGAPVVVNNAIVGYVTLALDHDHIMEFVDHILPTPQRYSELSDAYEGNYAFIWDHKGRSIAHPRHHSIAGYHPKTGDAQIPWLESGVYERWQKSGKPYEVFIVDEPTFAEQSVNRKPAAELTEQGLVGLDCRYLHFAPQCTGWFDLTRDGGSGSFNILWSGLRKLTTAAAIPYYTGQYAASPRGFGFVTIGAGLDEFHRPAAETGKVINKLMAETDVKLKDAVENTHSVILDHLTKTGLNLSMTTLLMTFFVVLIAVWLASVFTRRITSIIKGMSHFQRGERHFRFNAPVKDEMGMLCDSFDRMADSLENAVQGTLVITDVQGRVIYANNTFLQNAGLSLAEVLGKPYSDISSFAQHNLLECHHAGQAPVIEFHEPSQTYYRGVAEPHKNEQGETIGYVVASTDVTSMIETQRRLEEQHLILDSMINSSTDMIWYKNAEGAYLAVNTRFAEYCGKTPEEIIGRTVHDILPGRHSDVGEQEAAIQKNRVQIRSEETALFPDGHSELLDIIRTPVFDAEGEFLGIFGLARDITALHNTQNELEKAMQNALEANAAKSQFLANMSHEIRTPMNAILGFTYIAMQQNLPEAQRDMFAKIQAAATGLLGVINDILDFSKIEARKLDLESNTFSLREHLLSVVDTVRIQAAEKDIDAQVCIAPDIPANVCGDATRFRQVMLNLLSNAVKFTEKGGVLLEAETTEQNDTSCVVRFSVYDTGMGIAPETLSRLFQPFVQADASTTRRFGGTGLGLVISKELTTLMGGTLQIESEPHFGSVFSVTLPFDIVREDNTIAHPQHAVNAETMKRLAGKHVLLVEDNDINQMIAQSLLEQAGLIVTIATNGAEAVEAVRTGHFDMVFMDIQMPVMGGLEAARHIRALPEVRPSLPIVAMTAHAMSDDHSKSLEAGMNDHITKPIDPERLFAALLRWIH